MLTRIEYRARLRAPCDRRTGFVPPAGSMQLADDSDAVAGLTAVRAGPPRSRSTAISARRGGRDVRRRGGDGSRTASVGLNACRGIPGSAMARRPCRTSVPTGPRSPTPSGGCGCLTGGRAKTAGCHRSAALGYRTSVLKHSDAAIVPGGRVRARSEGRSAPLRYCEPPRRLEWNPASDRSAAGSARPCWRCAGKGSFDEQDHDTRASDPSSPTRWVSRGTVRAAGRSCAKADRCRITRRPDGPFRGRLAQSSTPGLRRVSR